MTTLDREAIIEEMAEALRKCLYTKTGNAIAAENVYTFERAAKALEAYRALSSIPEKGAGVKPEWRCFHCDEVFTDEHAARLHFGTDERIVPACQIKGSELGLVEALRRAENDAAEAWHAIHNETTDASKAYYRMVTRHQEQLRAVEQVGYDRGIADAKAHPETLGLALTAEAQLSAIPLKVVGYGRDAGRLTRVEVLDGADRIDLFRPPSQPAAVGVTDEMVERVSVPYDGFTGDVIGSYTTREGKHGVVVQQDGTRVVHVYGRSRVEAALRSTP